MSGPPRVSIVVPTLNEGGNIGPLLERLDRTLAGVPHEVIVVDDGSTDGTRSRARRAGENVHVVKRLAGGDLASAVVRGIDLAEGEHVCVMDGDLQHPPEVVPDLLRASQWRQADLVVGSRYTGGGKATGFPWHRRAISAGARSLILAMLPGAREARLTDPTSGLFLFRRDRVDPDELDPTGYKILLEVLEKGDFETVEEVGYTFQARGNGDSNLSPAVAWETLQHLVRLALADGRNQRLLKFAAVGLLGVIVNLGLLTLLTERFGLHYLVSATIAVEASILSNFALNDAYTFRDLRQGSWLRRLWRFNVVSLLALLVNLAVLSLLTEVLEIHYVVSEVAAIGVAFATNYRGNLDWTYVAVSESTPPPGEPSLWGRLSAWTQRLYGQAREKFWAMARRAPGQDDDLG